MRTTASLKSLTSKIGSGATPRGGDKVYIGQGVSFIRSQNITDFYFSKEGLVCIDDDSTKQLNNVEVMQNDILLNITGDSVARCCIVDKDILPARVNQHVAIVRANQYNNGKYIFYYLQYLKDNLLSLSEIGATRRALTKGMLELLAICIPSTLAEQQAIAAVLSSLDDKINLLHRQNKTLEALAQTLFRQWFVEEADEGWEEIILSTVANVLSGFAFKSSFFIGGGEYKLITIKAVQDGALVLDGADTLNNIPMSMPSYCKLKFGDILLSLTGNVGRCCFVDTYDNILLNQRVALIQPKVPEYWEYLFTLFRSQFMRSTLEDMAKGTAQPNLSPVETANMKVVIPSISLLGRVVMRFLPIR